MAPQTEALQKADLYQADLSEATWLSAPESQGTDRLEVAYLGSGNVALRNPGDPAGTVLFYDAAEWSAFLRGAQDGEFHK